jgi:hypothetical protein
MKSGAKYYMGLNRAEQMRLLFSFHKTGGVFIQTLNRGLKSSWNVF